MVMLGSFKSWAFIFPLIGVGFGWLLNESSQWIRVRREDKKTLKSILYNLLQIYALLKKLNRSNIENALKKLISQIFQSEENQIQEDLISHVASHLIASQIELIFNDDLPTAKANFQSSIVELSKIYPLIAFELHNNAGININSAFEILEGILQKMVPDYKQNSRNDDSSVFIEHYLKPMIIEQSVIAVGDDITYLAKKIGWLSWYKSRKIIKRLSTDIDEKAIEKVATHFRETFKDFYLTTK